MNNKFSFFNLIVFIVLLSSACNSERNAERDISSSDMIKTSEELSKDEDIASDQVLKAMGGSQKWEELKYVSWTFFNARHLIWDKLNSQVRIESPNDSAIYILNMKNDEGRYWKNGIEELDSEKLKEKMTSAKRIWINDMYWLFMPFKLQDPGVTMRYVKEDKIASGASCSIYSLTFEGVGVTPENKYEIAIDHSDKLIKQWTFFEKAERDTAYATWPWDNYKEYNGILLSADRSDGKGPSNVRVYDKIDDTVFTSFKGIEYY